MTVLVVSDFLYSSIVNSKQYSEQWRGVRQSCVNTESPSADSEEEEYVRAKRRINDTDGREMKHW